MLIILKQHKNKAKSSVVNIEDCSKVMSKKKDHCKKKKKKNPVDLLSSVSTLFVVQDLRSTKSPFHALCRILGFFIKNKFRVFFFSVRRAIKSVNGCMWFNCSPHDSASKCQTHLLFLTHPGRKNKLCPYW